MTANSPPQATNDASTPILVILTGEASEPPGFLLGASRLSVGAGEHDDIYLAGVGVVPSHLYLVFVDGVITVLGAAQEIRVDGQAVHQFPFDLQPLQVLSLSPDTHIAYGPNHSTWPLAPKWEMPHADITATDTPLPADDVAAPPTGHDNNSQVAEAFFPDDTPSTPRTTRERVTASAQIGALVLLAAVFFVVALVLFDLVWGSREVVVPQESAIDRSENSLDDLLNADRAAYRYVQLEKRMDGVLALTGFVDSEEAFRRLAEQVRQQVVNSGGNVRFDVLTVERLSALVHDHLVSYPMGYTISAEQDWVRVLVFGVQPEAAMQERLGIELSRLGDRVAPRRLAIEFKLQAADVLANDLATALARTSATRDMQVNMQADGAHIAGLVAAPVETDARAGLEQVKEAFAQRVPLFVDLKVDPKLNFTVVSLTLGGNESSATLMQRGKTQTFRVGEAVFGTGELREVKIDGVVVALGRREMFIPLIR